MARTCELQQTKRQQIKGSGLTVARFACPIMRDDYRPGRRVHVKILLSDFDNTVERTFVGTVMRWKRGIGSRLLVCLDSQNSVENDGETNKAIVSAWPIFVIPLDEPDRPYCSVCNLPKGAVVEDWHCGCQPNQSFGAYDINPHYVGEVHDEPMF